jgi:hypothetical protein
VSHEFKRRRSATAINVLFPLRHDVAQVGQWLLEHAVAFDTAYGPKWSAEQYGTNAKHALLLCYVKEVDSRNAHLCIADGGVKPNGKPCLFDTT